MEEEVWNTIPGFGDWYQASNLGRLRSLRYGKIKIMRPHFDKRGYGRTIFHVGGEGRWSGVRGVRKCIFVHKAVWLAFYGEVPDGLELDHIDQNPGNNELLNLQIVTHKENMRKVWVHMRSRGRTAMRPVQTHCKRGHDLNGPGVHRDAKGRRTCRLCAKERRLAYAAHWAVA